MARELPVVGSVVPRPVVATLQDTFSSAGGARVQEEGFESEWLRSGGLLTKRSLPM
jgi:hypothetical protein